jgi:hypothetical protein
MKEPWKERKRVGGRFVREGLDSDASSTTAKKAVRSEKVKMYARARVAEALGEIMDRFVEEAKNGSVAHTKVLTSLGGLDGTKKRAGQPKARRRNATAVLQEIARNMSKLEND